MLSKAEDPLDTRRGAFLNPFYVDPDDGSADDLAAIGIQVETVEAPVPVYRPAGGS